MCFFKSINVVYYLNLQQLKTILCDMKSIAFVWHLWDLDIFSLGKVVKLTSQISRKLNIWTGLAKIK